MSLKFWAGGMDTWQMITAGGEQARCTRPQASPRVEGPPSLFQLPRRMVPKKDTWACLSLL